MTPIIPIKTALRTALVADTALLALLGGAKVFDDVPRGTATPYIAFGDVTARENGSATDRGHLVDLHLAAWSRQGGSREAAAIIDRITAILDDVVRPLTGHRMIQCRITTTEIRRMSDQDLTRATLRLRLVTEVI